MSRDVYINRLEVLLFAALGAATDAHQAGYLDKETESNVLSLWHQIRKMGPTPSDFASMKEDMFSLCRWCFSPCANIYCQDCSEERENIKMQERS